MYTWGEIMEIKNGRLLPSGQFEFTDNGVVLTIVDVMNGMVSEKRHFEELNDALKTYRDKVKEIGLKIAEIEAKEKPTEKPKDELD